MTHIDRVQVNVPDKEDSQIQNFYLEGFWLFRGPGVFLLSSPPICHFYHLDKDQKYRKRAGACLNSHQKCICCGFFFSFLFFFINCEPRRSNSTGLGGSRQDISCTKPILSKNHCIRVFLSPDGVGSESEACRPCLDTERQREKSQFCQGGPGMLKIARGR